jgi:GT2 family glycosyltransferase
VKAPSDSVAVVIPTRNRPQPLERAVRSALAQSFPRAEVVVVDGRVRPTVRLPPDLACDHRLTVVKITRSEGSPAARNLGVAPS